MVSIGNSTINLNGQALEVIVIIMSVYLFLNLVISVVMNSINRIVIREADETASKCFPRQPLEIVFYSPIASVVTIGLFLLIGAAGWYAWKWGVSDAIFRADFKACMNNHDGACWGFVAEKWRLILFGRFPYDEQWRAAAATGGVILLLVISAFPQLWNRTGCKILTAGWILVLGAFFVLMLGGCFGLSKIDPDYWGGLPLTVILTLFGMTASTPLGILLALGRRSKMSAVRMLCIGYIELVRGVP